MALISTKSGRCVVVTTIYLPEEIHAESRLLGINRTRIAEQAIRAEIARIKEQKATGAA